MLSTRADRRLAVQRFTSSGRSVISRSLRLGWQGLRTCEKLAPTHPTSTFPQPPQARRRGVSPHQSTCRIGGPAPEGSRIRIATTQRRCGWYPLEQIFNGNLGTYSIHGQVRVFPEVSLLLELERKSLLGKHTFERSQDPPTVDTPRVVEHQRCLIHITF